jgi:hypothetical protein
MIDLLDKAGRRSQRVSPPRRSFTLRRFDEQLAQAANFDRKRSNRKTRKKMAKKPGHA